jgi:UDP-N-acetylglucosamine 1-carboxyvinyltransferase
MIARIRGNSKIEGEITVGGAKNSALPVLASLVLISEEIKIEKIPDISDVSEMLSMIRSAGVAVSFEKNTVLARPSNLKGEIREFGSSIRASILLLGPLAVRTGHAELRYPGGCSIGKRSIDIHIEGLKKLGISVNEKNDMIEAIFDKVLKDVRIDLRFPSVGATEHLMMTSVLLNGIHTEIRNCAKEPEIVDLGKFLNSMGAKISGVGTDRISIDGVKKLNASVHSIIGDRIETGTYIIGALSSGGMLKINGISNTVMHNVTKELKKIGARITASENALIVYPSDLRPFKLSTGPYPQFPTDLQPQMTLLACHVNGHSEITETVFENRFRHVDELKKMGANISVEKNKIEVMPSKLHGAKLVGNDLRETATILFAAATADGPSEIEKFEIIFRGYENIYKKLKDIGIDFEILKIDREVS